MSYCSKCGRKIEDETTGCYHCGKEANRDEIESFIVESEDGTSQRFESRRSEKEFIPVEDHHLHIGIKILLILATVFMAGVGSVVGLIIAVILLKSPFEEYAKFGKTLIIISCVTLGMWFLCCLLGGAFTVVTNMIFSF